MSGIVKIDGSSRSAWYDVTSGEVSLDMCREEFDEVFSPNLNLLGEVEVEITRSRDKDCKIFLDTIDPFWDEDEEYNPIEINFLSETEHVDSVSVGVDLDWLKPLCTFRLDYKGVWQKNNLTSKDHLYDWVIPIKIRVRLVGAKRWIYPWGQKAWS